jgi:TonB-dependent starch-binding outer membrane protein SusC
MQISTNVRRIALFFLSMVLSSGIIFAQEKTITGKVTAEGEGPLPGVNVTVQGTVVGAMTDLNGAYTIKVPSPAAVLVFSSIGYTTKSVTVGTQNVIDMVLASDVRALQEVVVTGYTSQRRKDLTGSVNTVEPAKLTAIPTGNVTNSLQGRTSGVIVTGNGQPGSVSQVRIRGYSSFENNDPLYIVDGVPTQDISTLNPGDIESISVLKDAGAASIYGSRASNGVIIVSTRKGSKGTKVNYSMYYGMQDPGKGPDNVLNTQEFADLRWKVYRNDGTATTNPDGTPVIDAVYGPIGNATPTLPYWAGNTNWYDEITHKAPIMNHDISLSGGTDNAKFFAAIDIFTQDGIIIHTNSDRYTGRFNSEFNFLKDHVKVGENLTMSYSTSHGVGNLDESSPIQQGPYRSQPIIPVIMTVAVPEGLSHAFVPGDWGGTGIAPNLGQAENEVASLTRAKDNSNWTVRMIGSAFIDIKILQGLNFKSTLGGTFANNYNYSYSYKTYERSENNSTNSFYEGASYGNDWVWTNQLTLDKTFGQHKILAIAGYESVKYEIGRGVSGNRAGYYTDDVLYRTLNNGATTIAANSYLNTPTTLLSQFARADYSFMDRYMLSATIRRDGSSRFGENNRYGVFPSFSAGWRISDEEFFKGITFINDMKIRGSYGTMGNQLAVRPENQFYNYGGDPSTSFYDINGTFTSSVQGFRPTHIGNPDAKWETSINTNIGFEANILQNKIGIKFDWYSKVTKDLLYPLELPGVAGSATAPYVNVAGMSNKGLDVELSYKQKFGELGVDVSANITTVKNNIDEIAEGVDFFYSGGSRIGSFVRNEVGHPMSSFYGYQVVSLFQENEFHTELNDAGDEVLALNDGIPTQDGAAPGFFKYQDTDGDKAITEKDRTFIGDPNPNFTYGINLGFTYKNFDLTAFLYGSQGNDIFNFNTWWIDFYPSFQGQKSTTLLYDSWTPENPNTKVPKASAISNFSTNTQSTSYYVEDGSFLRLRNLQLGYTIPESVLSKASIKSLRVYVQAVNLFTITKYSGLDPEIQAQYGNDQNHGVDYGNYPLVKQFLFGLNVSF